MSSFPKIDSPCPLRWKSAPEAGRDFCTQCRRRVHNLDALDDAQRRALLAGCETDICVSYSVPRRRFAPAAAGLGLAAALSFGAAAAEIPADRSPVAAQALIPSEPRADCATEAEEQTELVEVMVGGISSAREAEWDEASNLPDLPLAGPGAFENDAEFVAPPSAQPD
ncbi:MAG TPA: hypothetical protein VLF18_19615 [Tahibacter sp.]|uniref:hypothetical protein n=1 Tax=Tahibacter sp. TaxID=2056211 RepID=UPI002CCEDA88|nr:hypothetical protein [Tahibacter sp.]HSX62399.1 hypothetical protein [Tahibacter sp.]